MKKLLVLFAALFPIAVHAELQDVDAVPWITESGKKAYTEKFLTGAKSRAFAVSKSGSYAWSVNRESEIQAAQFALYNCIKKSGQRCFLYAVNDKAVLDSYVRADEAALAALAKLVVPSKKAYASEDKDVGIAHGLDLKSGQLHEPTPATISFAQTVSTATFAEMLKLETKPIILDVLQPTDGLRKEAVPSSLWISGAGIFDEKFNSKIDELFSKLMFDIAPKKDTPIVVYCLSWQCWLSYNALLRLSKQGYTSLYWYRGGIESWQRAGLPTVEIPLSGQVW